ncbi:UNVERIFIED_CONTAM: hypothetical protein Slati_0172000 [Sesamum latifolium]|uniref:RNase H type-1 domain-containing protein n=1 Tax=Sesamum latifolium TaxID=2727402 RepID=A0AAW2YAS3_9LAMI
MVKYLLKMKNLLEKFKESSLIQVSRIDNVKADQLAKLPSSMAAIQSRRITFLSLDKAAIEEQIEVMWTNPTPPSWKEDIVKFLIDGTTPKNKKEVRALRVKASHFVMIDRELYKCGFSQPFLKCLTSKEGNYV